MTSILDQHENNRTSYHVCGGTILYGFGGDSGQYYCDRCGAFTHDVDGELPDGTDPEANREAFDSGDIESPSA